MPCDLETVQASACTSGIGKISDKVKLLQVIAELSCEENAPPSGPFLIAENGNQLITESGNPMIPE